MTDLFVLTADAQMKAVFDAILPRHKAMGIRQISFEVVPHPVEIPAFSRVARS